MLAQAAALAQTYPRIPFAILEQLVAWRDGRRPMPFGSFLTAVLANDFSKAVLRADPENFTAIKDYARFMLNELPSEAWGSYDKVQRYVLLQQQLERDNEPAGPVSRCREAPAEPPTVIHDPSLTGPTEFIGVSPNLLVEIPKAEYDRIVTIRSQPTVCATFRSMRSVRPLASSRRVRVGEPNESLSDDSKHIAV